MANIKDQIYKDTLIKLGVDENDAQKIMNKIDEQTNAEEQVEREKQEKLNVERFKAGQRKISDMAEEVRIVNK